MVKDGQKACVSYVGTFEDGTVFDKSADHGETFDFIVGSGNVIAGFDEAVRSMEVGDTRTVTIPPAEAYGERRENLVDTVPLSMMPDADTLRTLDGQSVYFDNNGQMMEASVTINSDDTVTLDFNHPMAGRTLVFELTLEAVSDGESDRPAGSRTQSVPKPASPAAPGEIA